MPLARPKSCEKYFETGMVWKSIEKRNEWDMDGYSIIKTSGKKKSKLIAVMKLSPNDEFDFCGALERHYRARIVFNFFLTHLYDREFQYEHVAVLESCLLWIFPEENVSIGKLQFWNIRKI